MHQGPVIHAYHTGFKMTSSEFTLIGDFFTAAATFQDDKLFEIFTLISKTKQLAFKDIDRLVEFVSIDDLTSTAEAYSYYGKFYRYNQPLLLSHDPWKSPPQRGLLISTNSNGRHYYREPYVYAGFGHDVTLTNRLDIIHTAAYLAYFRDTYKHVYDRMLKMFEENPSGSEIVY